MAFRAPAVSPLIQQSAEAVLFCIQGLTHFETNPLASVDRRLASANTPSGPLGSGSYRSWGERTSSSSASMSIFLNAYSDMARC